MPKRKKLTNKQSLSPYGGSPNSGDESIKSNRSHGGRQRSCPVPKCTFITPLEVTHRGDISQCLLQHLVDIGSRKSRTDEFTTTKEKIEHERFAILYSEQTQMCQKCSNFFPGAVSLARHGRYWRRN